MILWDGPEQTWREHEGRDWERRHRNPYPYGCAGALWSLLLVAILVAIVWWGVR